MRLEKDEPNKCMVHVTPPISVPRDRKTDTEKGRTVQKIYMYIDIKNLKIVA